MNQTNIPHTMLGVPGRLTQKMKTGALWQTQKWLSAGRPIKGYGTNGTMFVSVRYDDQCGNGKNSFAITADVYTNESRAQNDIAAGGCMHDEIAKVFPELAPLIMWHLCDSIGPMHYVANTVYLAGDRDCNGMTKGEVRQIKNGRTGEPVWQLATFDAEGREVPREELRAMADQDERPAVEFVTRYAPVNRIGEGKERQLDAARSTAVWPEATDEQLCLPKTELEALLLARLPALLERFRAAVEGAGLNWTPNK